ncbi:hypothetical protein Q8F55_006534 [Vanrija albida]|uniref:Exocyst complex component Sec3 PIP2-binding N-terminal domain-containing protein n=1 Tax=Vanrija albida TaxID=181172 RepID=A0ABR3PXK4_9TREE
MGGRRPSTASADTTRTQMTASLFSRTDADGTLEEQLVSHIVIHEPEPGGVKTRYLMLAVTKDRRYLIHKGKRNSNGTFSKGKTWSFDDMRALERVGPAEFSLTMTVRRYVWKTDREDDMAAFLTSLVVASKAVPRPQNLAIINFVPESPRAQRSPLPVTGRLPAGSASQASLREPALAPPRPVGRGDRGERNGSFSSMGSSAPSQSDSYGRSPVATVDGGGFGRRAYGDSSTNIGIGRPPPQRQGSSDRGLRPEVTKPSPTLSTTSLRPPRRPSATAPDIPPIVEPPHDAYGGVGEEVLVPPVAAAPPRPALRVVNATLSPSPEGSPRSQAAALSPVTAKQPSLSPVASKPPSLPSASPAASKAALPSASPAPSKSPSLAPAKSPKAPGRARTPESTASAEGAPGAKRRVSFVAQPLTTAYSRDVLLTSRTGLTGTDAVIGDEAEDAGDAMMANVEEMIKGFDWTASASAVNPDGTRAKGDTIESRLLDELAALESANIHAFLESDDRIDQVIAHIGEALQELDDIDMHLTGYRLQLNAVTEDIAYIEGQNRGLQVQTSNQRALLEEVQQLIQITDVPRADLQKLSQTSPSTPRGVKELELAAASLYKAIQASRDQANEVAATATHAREYQAASTQFAMRILEYLDIAFKHQSDTTLADYKKGAASGALKLVPHTALGESLMTYEGLVLFVKDMDEDKYKKLCLNYITTASKLHQEEMKDLLMNLIKALNSTKSKTNPDVSFSRAAAAVPKPTTIGGAVVRSKTMKRPNDTSSKEEQGRKADEATRKVSELYKQGMGEVVNQVVTEDDFINAFLHLADTESTFADYMELDSYFRRQAARHAAHGMSPGLAQVTRSRMDLLFGFVEGEFKNWVDAAIQKNPVAIVGVIAITESLAREAEQLETSLFLLQLFDKQLGRQRQSFDQFIAEQVKTIDAAKASIRRRQGPFYFVKHFPVFVERIESQLDGCEGLPIRDRVNGAYERVVAAVLGSLQHVSKIVGAEMASGEEKGQLYFHVVMIENLHLFVDEVSALDVPALDIFLQRAKGLYEENMKAYIKLMLRRGFARLIDFFDTVERLLKTTPANEVSVHDGCSKSNLKKVLKETTAKDMRKAVETMARRVDKHFNEEETATGVGAVVSGGGSSVTPSDPATAALIAAVWRELSAGLRREVERATTIMGKSYADSGLSLEYTAQDVDTACRRAKH